VCVEVSAAQALQLRRVEQTQAGLGLLEGAQQRTRHGGAGDRTPDQRNERRQRCQQPLRQALAGAAGLPQGAAEMVPQLSAKPWGTTG